MPGLDQLRYKRSTPVSGAASTVSQGSERV